MLIMLPKTSNDSDKAANVHQQCQI